MKTTATTTTVFAAIIAAAVATTALTTTLSPWQAAHAAGGGEFHYGQRLYSLGDYTGALSIWQPLAERGEAKAQYSLAIMYLKGRGVTMDKAEAKAWARKAADQGYRPAQKLLQVLERKKPAKKFAKTADVKTAQKPRKPRKPKKPRKALSAMTELERVEAAVEDLLQQIAGKVAKDGSLEYGDLKAVQLANAPNAIEITIPDLVINAADGGVFSLGTVVAHVRHLDARFDDITLALPGVVRFRQPFGGAWGRITIARRLATIRWDRQLETSTDFEFRFGDLVFLLDDKGEMGRVAEVLVQADLKEADDLWTGPMRFALDKVNITSENGGNLKLDRVNLVLDLRGLDIAAYANRKETDTNTVPTMPTLKDALGLANGVGLRAIVDGLALTHPSQGNFSLGGADYGIDLSSDDGRMLKLSLTTKHHGLVGTGSAAPEALVPKDLDIALVLDSVPSETVVNVGVAAVIEVALLGQLISGPQTFDRLRDELSAAGAVLQLKRANITAQDYDIAMAMTLLADKAAKAGFLGDGNLRIRGLDKLRAIAGDQKGGPMAMIFNKGKPIDGDKGRLFELQVRPDGQLTVNNDPVASLAPFQDGTN